MKWVHKNGMDLESKEETGGEAGKCSYSRASTVCYAYEQCVTSALGEGTEPTQTLET